MVNELKTKGIVDDNVLQAMEKIPRHFFLDSAFDKIAYEDRPFPIAANQTISRPYTVAYQTQLLEVKKGMRVMEIGTGSMYQCTVLAELGAWVFTIERQKELWELQEYYPFRNRYPNIKFFYKDGFEGLPGYGLFDRILVTAAAPFIPPKLVEQLKVNGIMVIPVNNESGEKQIMKRIKKISDTEIVEEILEDALFVPMLTGKN